MALFPDSGVETMRTCGDSGAKSGVFDPLFATQHEHGYRVNLLWRHGTIAIAYKTRDICSAMTPPFSATSTSPRKSLEIVSWAETTKNGFSTSCAMRSQNDKRWMAAGPNLRSGVSGTANQYDGTRLLYPPHPLVVREAPMHRISVIDSHT
ncbi:MAG TPA: hypothetical protein VLM40_18865, partial [Gemmata sp.]|nr:hypothetical protein [Gemmata sp.]